MRIRYKPWARKELEESPFYKEQSEQLLGKWRNEFKKPDSPFFVELRLWKGQFYCTKSSETSRK